MEPNPEWTRQDESEETYVRNLTPREYGIYAYAHSAKWNHSNTRDYFRRQVQAHNFAVSCVTEYRAARQWADMVQARQNVIRFDSAFDADYRIKQERLVLA